MRFYPGCTNYNHSQDGNVYPYLVIIRLVMVELCNLMW